MDIPQFRLDFPEFSDALVYTNNIITFWSNLGEQVISSDAFGSVYTQAVNLFTAHNISLAIKNIEQSSAGGQPGTIGGAIESKAVGSVNISYDTTDASYKDAGFWNQTVYGRQYFYLVKLFGQGCYQL
jgi:hypothetical protein